MHRNAHMPPVGMPHHMVAASDPFQFPAALAQCLDDVLPGELDRHQAASPTVTAISLVSSSGTDPAPNKARMPSARSSSASSSVSPTPKALRFPGRPIACTPHAKESGAESGSGRPGSSRISYRTWMVVTRHPPFLPMMPDSQRSSKMGAPGTISIYYLAGDLW